MYTYYTICFIISPAVDQSENQTEQRSGYCVWICTYVLRVGSPALPKQGNFEKPNWVPRLGLNSDENGGIWFLGSYKL